MKVHIDYPELGVIDKAVKALKEYSAGFSCVALAYAAGRSPLDFDSHEYCRQFRQFCQDEFGNLPFWWNGNTYSRVNRQARIEALKAFRRACVKAAKKGAK